ncbi:hypothetical protein [Pseudomonas arsenicoxydans]|uniref:Uncharacterized protein n=1 Tax=Pseudomonas arsenicoxydans TaxID=702115 RepID=A0A502HNJ0_9PSED|nr:hypothetical protein [Pseudomonas arsenicoxydans]TPG75355.1 hypothetical protein EAH78_21090 [Pseudomonas arsenicoxydans]
MKASIRLHLDVPYFIGNIDKTPFDANQKEVRDDNLPPPFENHYIFAATQREPDLSYREIRIILPKSLEYKTYRLTDAENPVHVEYISEAGSDINVYKGIEGTIELFESHESNAVAATFKVKVEDDNHDTELDIDGSFDMLLP